MAYKYAESRKAAVRRYLADKKSFNVYFQEDVYNDLKEHGIDTQTIRELALAELEKRKTGKGATVKIEKVIYQKNDIMDAINKLNGLCMSIADKVGVETTSEPEKAVIKENNEPIEEVIEEPEIMAEPIIEEPKEEPKEEKIPSWLDNI